MTSKPDLLALATRSDLATCIHRTYQTVSPGQRYLHNWHLEVIAHRLQQALDGKITRLIITVPPRSLKSICCSVAFPAFILGHQPAARVICASYSSDLAFKHARDCRAVMETQWYRDSFARTRLDRAKNTEQEMTTTRRGFRLATSVGGTLTGRGGNFLILDYIMKADQALSEAHRQTVVEWIVNTAMSRLDDKKTGVIILVMQHLHVDDPVGHLLEQGGWNHLNLPAIAEEDQWFDLGHGHAVGRREGEALHPEREPLETLEQLCRALGSPIFSAQYQQDPMPLEGGLIKWSWFRFYEALPEPHEGDLIVQSWDTAAKGTDVSSYSVCTTWLRRGHDHYLLDVRRLRLEYPALRKLVVEMAEQYDAGAVLIEDKASGTQLIQELPQQGALRIEPIEPEGDKAIRMYGQTAKIEAGHVFLPLSAPWLDEFQRELLPFPNSRYWDQIDSVSQYLGWESPVVITDEHFMIGEPLAAHRPDAPWNLDL